MAGPMVRTMDPVICARPLVAPKDRLFGAAAVINIKIQPTNRLAIAEEGPHRSQLTERHVHENSQHQRTREEEPDKPDDSILACNDVGDGEESKNGNKTRF